MRSRLGLRVFAVLFVLNLAVFAGLGAFLEGRLERQRAALVLGLTEQIVASLEREILPAGELNVARILDWPGWSNVADAVVVDSNLERSPAGRLWPRGVALHPVGQARGLTGRDGLLEGLAACIDEGRRVPLAGGLAVPLVVGGGVWGALWFVPREDPTAGDLSRLLWSGFAVSTVLLLVGTFAALRPLVIEPVGRLAEAARRVSRGDLSARVEGGARRDEISDLVRSFNHMAARVERLTENLGAEVQTALDQARRAEAAVLIQKRLAAMGELAAGIAHEINNPLGGLQNAVRALGRADLPPERRERYLTLLADGLERIRGTVGQVLRMAPRQTSAVRLDLVEVVRDAAALVRHRAEQLGVSLVARVGQREFDPCDPPAGLPPHEVIGARQELGQALLNLLVNALDALEESGRGGRVEVELARAAGAVRVAVRDDGPGAAVADLDRLTDLFFTTKEVGRGTGLGLAIVHNVLDTHGGRLELESRPAEGFTATCVLPEAPER